MQAGARAALLMALAALWAAGALARAAPAAAANPPILHPSAPAAAQAVAAPAVAAPPAAPIPAAPTPAAPAPTAPAAAAPTPAPPPTVQQSLAADAGRLADIDNQAPTISNDARLAVLEGAAARIEAEAREDLGAADARAASAERKIAAIVPRWRRRPTAAEAAKAAPYMAERDAATSQAAAATSVVSAAETTFSLVAERRREGFTNRVLTRSASPLEPGFWSDLAGAAGGDGARLGLMTADALTTALGASEPRGLIRLVVGLVVAVLLVWPARRLLVRLARRSARPGKPAPVRRSGAALAGAICNTVTAALAVAALRLAAEWGGLVSPAADALLRSAVTAAAWGAGIIALGRALATERDPAYRMLPLSDEAARRVRLPLMTVAVVTACGFLLTRLIYVVGASVAATMAADCALSLAYAAVAVLIVASFGRWRVRARSEPAPAAGARAPSREADHSPVWTLISLALTGAASVTVAAVFLGYSTLASLVSAQIFWLSIIATAAWLLMRFADDLVAALFADRGWASRSLRVLFGFRGSAIGQTGALVSAALQVVILVGAASLALTPFGQGGGQLVSHLSGLAGPFRLGSAVISPAAILTGLATLLLGVAVARGVRGWVERRYLPVTDWDAGLRNSVSTGVGYLGVCIAIVCALAAAGIGLGQITLVASALGVGVGFGLQQVVQNFVAGVILLVERPVKVGDWVNVGGVEGDIRRIRVRATEIATFDRTTVIVPNSNLITMPVQNKTAGDPSGRVELKLSITKAAESARARDLIVETIKAHPGVSDASAPDVYVDSLASTGAVNLTVHFRVEDLRKATRIRSESFFQVMEALGKAEIAFTGVPAA